MRLSEILNKERDGHAITDEELFFATKQLAMILASPVSGLGERFSLFIKELNLIFDRFEGYAIARGLIEKRYTIGVES